MPGAVPGLVPSAGAQWTRDGYGSRFAVTAPFGPDRWYLWDIDACTYRPITVHSGFYRSADDALADWRSGVGDVAATGAGWTEIDDTGLLEALLPKVEGLLAVGGESPSQLAEYLRGRGLAEAVLAATPRAVPELPDEPTHRDFVSWMRRQAPADLPADLDELADALAEIWPMDVEGLYHCCSPHRVAHVALTVHEEWLDDYPDRVLALLPAWVTWLGEVAGTPSDLVDRALPYARGEIHPDLGAIARLADYQLRVAE